MKLHQARYYYEIKGYLTVVDILHEVEKNGDYIGNSVALKDNLFGKIFGDDGAKLDADVRDQL